MRVDLLAFEPGLDLGKMVFPLLAQVDDLLVRMLIDSGGENIPQQLDE